MDQTERLTVEQLAASLYTMMVGPVLGVNLSGGQVIMHNKPTYLKIAAECRAAAEAFFAPPAPEPAKARLLTA